MGYEIGSFIASMFGGIVGAVLVIVSDNFLFKTERKDKYLFALIDKKFEAHQEAYVWCEKLSWFVHVPNDIDSEETTGTISEKSKKKIAGLIAMRNWFNQKWLYFNPSLRETLEGYIRNVSEYSTLNKDFYQFRREKGADHKETEQKREEMQAIYKNIRGTQKEIQKSIDVYYYETISHGKVQSPFKALCNHTYRFFKSPL